MFQKKLFPTFADDDATADAIERADGINYLPLDEATAVARPATLKAGWHELEFDQLVAEQKPLWTALGEKVARPFTVLAAKWKCRSEVANRQIDVQQDELDKAKADLDLHNDALQGHTRREPHAKAMYLLRWGLLLLGDIAGIAGAAILLGEIVDLAVLQAVASAIAAVTAGIVGNDIRDARLARRRERDLTTLPNEHRKFAWVFSGADIGEKIVTAIILVGVTITLLIIGGIFALRAGVEGSLGGVVFGCLAGAICLASALNTYHYADEIADLLDHAYERYLRSSRRLAKLSNSKAIATYDAATAEATSIKIEHAERGAAGALKIAALKHGVSRQNPAVMGHGPAADAPPSNPDRFSTMHFDIPDVAANGASPNGSRP